MEAIISSENPETLFEITEILGEGSYANVYKAISLKDGKPVAIKIIPTGDDVSELKKEIEILENCENPNIVKYYGCYKDQVNFDFWIVMEYCEAGSISDLMGICNILLTESQIAVILKEILIGINYLHKNKLVHRDIKGGNILLNSKGQIKITDFGVSAKLSSTFSKRSTAIGTPYWMAPEVLLENNYNYKADMWSLGITAIELSLGNPPFSEMHPMKAVLSIPKKPPPRLPNNFSKKFRNFVRLLLTKKELERPSAAEMLKHPFIRSAKSKKILKDLYEKCIPTINKFRENYEVDPDKSTLSTRKTGMRTTIHKGNANIRDTVQINKVEENEDEIDNWEQSLRFDDSGDEHSMYKNTVVINKVEDKGRDASIEMFDFSKPRPLQEKKGFQKTYMDTFQFYGRVPKKGHKYAADYYCGLSVQQLETILLEMEQALAEQHRELETNFKEEKNIVEYAIRVKKGEQKAFIPE